MLDRFAHSPVLVLNYCACVLCMRVGFTVASTNGSFVLYNAAQQTFSVEPCLLQHCIEARAEPWPYDVPFRFVEVANATQRGLVPSFYSGLNLCAPNRYGMLCAACMAGSALDAGECIRA
jgi:hypothetical protein